MIDTRMYQCSSAQVSARLSTEPRGTLPLIVDFSAQRTSQLDSALSRLSPTRSAHIDRCCAPATHVVPTPKSVSPSAEGR